MNLGDIERGYALARGEGADQIATLESIEVLVLNAVCPYSLKFRT
jgi:hypothetical protein